MVQNIFPRRQPRRPACDDQAFVRAGARLRKRRGLQIEIDVVADEEVEVAIAIVIEESAAGVPTQLRLKQPGLGGRVGEGPIAVVVKERVLAVVADEEVVVAIVVVVAHAASLSPAAARQSRLLRDIGEGAIAIVLEEMASGFLSAGKSFEPPTIDEK